MGNFHIYKLVLKNFLPDLFSRVIDAAGSLGYSCILEGAIHGFGSDGNELEFNNVQTAQTYLFLDGGLIFFARHCESCEDEDSLFFDVTFSPKDASLSISSQRSLFKENWGRVEQAVDLRRLWNILSLRLKPLYGYATSDWEWDFVINKAPIKEAWENFETKRIYYLPPPVLFWANYFDWAFYESIDKTIFDDVPHRKFVMPEEYVCIYLAEFPWEENRRAILGDDHKYHAVR